MVDFDTRVGAYCLIIDGDEILLAHWNSGGVSNWTLPGGGLEIGEDTETAAIRETLEETGYAVELNGLLGVDSLHIPAGSRLDGLDRHLHSLRVIYSARVVAGRLRRELDGSTDDARWFRLADVEGLDRVELVDVGIRLWRRTMGQAGEETSPADRLPRSVAR
jgi:8-oxo-dGTP diphosphatase